MVEVLRPATDPPAASILLTLGLRLGTLLGDSGLSLLRPDWGLCLANSGGWPGVVFLLIWWVMMASINSEAVMLPSGVFLRWPEVREL